MAIGAFIGLIMIVPEVLAMLPYEIVDDAVRYFPGKALETLTTAQPLPGTASPGAALLAMILWTTATLTLAAAVLRRRDV
ncbi:ABC transporter permease OS=Streptomyces violarus OX=67380 GN=FHS41_007685 PE=4 SV=1 [Streptomyces violarus]